MYLKKLEIVNFRNIDKICLELNKNVSVDEINKAFIDCQNETLGVTYDPVVSSDIIGLSLGSLVDAQLTNVIDVDGKQIVKVIVFHLHQLH